MSSQRQNFLLALEVFQAQAYLILNDILAELISNNGRKEHCGYNVAHILLALICYIFIATIDTIAINGTCALLGISYDEFIWRQFTYTVVTTMDKLLACFVTWLLYRFRQKKNMARIQNKWLLLSSLFPAVSAVMFVVFFYNIPRSEDASASIVVFSGILIIANIAMLYVTFTVFIAI